MDKPLLLVYLGEDNNPKLRLLSDTGIIDEIPANSVDYFQNKRVYLQHVKCCFYAYHPLGAKEDQLKFREVITAGIFSTMNGIPAYQLFNEMDQESAIDLYKDKVMADINNAFVEKQMSVVH